MIVYGSDAPEELKNDAAGYGDAVYYGGCPDGKKRNRTISAHEVFGSSSNTGWD
jgi:hypothetical protein